MINQKKIVDDITIWIDLHLCDRLTMDMIADRSGYSKWHLQRMFRNFNSITIGAYIRNKRLKKACAELIKTDDRIIDICERNGFVSQQSFSRTFVRKYGIPPAAFRQVRQTSLPSICGYLDN